jgi:CDP-diacylglycerol--glycerol-3-phosphate 3-phosphatidyltransferase
MGVHMAGTNRRIIPESLQKRCIKFLEPIFNHFARWGLSPNAFTVAGVIITTLAALAFILGYIRIGGILVLLGGLCDMFDGGIARAANKASRFGAFFDSALDRYSELALFFGMGAHFVMINDYHTSIVTFIALCGSIMVSYCRARAESLGFNAAQGIMQRPERIVLLGFGAMIHVIALKIAIWIVAILANVTAIQRIRHVYKQDSGKSGGETEIKSEH